MTQETKDTALALSEALALVASFADPVPDPYYVVVIPDAGDHVCAEFTNVDEAVAFLRGYVGQSVNVCVFRGVRCQTTKPPAVILHTPEGQFPLFGGPDSDEFDLTGAMTAPSPVLEALGMAPDGDLPGIDNVDDEQEPDDEEDEDDGEDEDEDDDEE